MSSTIPPPGSKCLFCARSVARRKGHRRTKSQLRSYELSEEYLNAHQHVRYYVQHQCSDVKVSPTNRICGVCIERARRYFTKELGSLAKTTAKCSMHNTKSEASGQSQGSFSDPLKVKREISYSDGLDLGLELDLDVDLGNEQSESDDSNDAEASSVSLQFDSTKHTVNNDSNSKEEHDKTDLMWLKIEPEEALFKSNYYMKAESEQATIQRNKRLKTETNEVNPRRNHQTNAELKKDSLETEQNEAQDISNQDNKANPEIAAIKKNESLETEPNKPENSTNQHTNATPKETMNKSSSRTKPEQKEVASISDNSKNATIPIANYTRVSSTTTYCVIAKCKARGSGNLNRINAMMRSETLRRQNIYVPFGARICKEHLHSCNTWRDFPHVTRTKHETFNSTQISDMLKLLQKPVEYINYEKLKNIDDATLIFLIGVNKASFLEILDKNPAFKAGFQKPKKTLAMVLSKVHTGDTDKILASMFHVNSKKFGRLVKKAISLLNEFDPIQLGYSRYLEKTENNTAGSIATDDECPSSSLMGMKTM